MYRVLLLLFLLLIPIEVQADHWPHRVLLEPDQVKIQVRGVVCSFCSYGAQKNLSKLEFLDPSEFTKGVHVDIDSQQITLALAKGKYMDLKKVYQSIKRGGYEPEIVFLRLRGQVSRENHHYHIQDQKNDLIFIVQTKDGVVLPDSGMVTADIHFAAKQIPLMVPGHPIEASLDQIVE